jgi:hypothetical protein
MVGVVGMAARKSARDSTSCRAVAKMRKMMAMATTGRAVTSTGRMKRRWNAKLLCR